MPIWFAAAAMAAAAAAQAISAKQANEAQKKQAAAQIAAQQQGQQAQADYQTEMSNTAHQRQVADMKAAGLNPILSAKMGGASTPSIGGVQGAQANIRPLVDSGTISAAFQTAQVVQGLEATEQSMAQSRAEERRLQAEEARINAETTRVTAASATETERERLVRNQVQTELDRQAQLRADTGLTGQRTRTEVENTGRTAAERRTAESEATHRERWGNRPTSTTDSAAAAEAVARRLAANQGLLRDRLPSIGPNNPERRLWNPPSTPRREPYPSMLDYLY